jgi:hypothetical protein
MRQPTLGQHHHRRRRTGPPTLGHRLLSRLLMLDRRRRMGQHQDTFPAWELLCDDIFCHLGLLTGGWLWKHWTALWRLVGHNQSVEYLHILEALTLSNMAVAHVYSETILEAFQVAARSENSNGLQVNPLFMDTLRRRLRNLDVNFHDVFRECEALTDDSHSD